MRRFLLFLIPPAVIAAAFFLLRPYAAVMDYAWRRAGAVWRFVLGHLTSYLPISLMETIGTALALLLVVFLAALVISLLRRRGVGRALRRIGRLVIVVAYGAAVFIWAYLPGYFAQETYSGALTRRDVSTDELAAAMVYFRDRANATAPEVKRDAAGVFDESVDDIITLSDLVYSGVTSRLPNLSGSRARPKKMLYSAIMSRTHFTGIYFALTGEAHINDDAPRAFLPFTAAHELAHSRGAAREDEANFVAVAACLTSNVTMYEYSGALAALNYIGSALARDDMEAYTEIASGYGEYVRLDFDASRRYWGEIDEKNARSPAVAAFAAAVTETYDGYLRANGQKSGMRSYGECVDLLTVWAVERGAGGAAAHPAS